MLKVPNGAIWRSWKVHGRKRCKGLPADSFWTTGTHALADWASRNYRRWQTFCEGQSNSLLSSETFRLRDRFWLNSVREKWQWTDLWMPLNSVRSWVDLKKTKRSWKHQWLSQHNIYRRKTNGVFRCRLPHRMASELWKNVFIHWKPTASIWESRDQMELKWHWRHQPLQEQEKLLAISSLSVLSREGWLVFPSWNDFYLDTCETKGVSLAVFKFCAYFYHTFWLVEFYIRFC